MSNFDNAQLKQKIMDSSIQNQWQETTEGLYKKIIFKNFVEAFSFMTKVALLAEKYNHHPTWKNSYKTVEIWLITHDAGNIITEKDRKLSLEIDAFL